MLSSAEKHPEISYLFSLLFSNAFTVKTKKCKLGKNIGYLSLGIGQKIILKRDC
jgi:hypothetical protein